MLLPHQTEELIEKIVEMKELLEDDSPIISIPEKFDQLKEILEEVIELLDLD